MKILFIGGNGNISWWCVQKAIEKGYEVYELNRAMSRLTRRPVQAEVHEIIADIRNEEVTEKALNGMSFDIVCDFICFSAEQAEQAIRVFQKKTKHYVVISSEAIYKRNSKSIPFTEDAEQYDSCISDKYIAGKIGVERVFCKAIENHTMNVTIVRPGFTYDTILQVPIGQNCFTAPQKYIDGYPFLIPGDGENLWAPLHSRDFASAFIPLIQNEKAKGQIVHIAGEQLITLNEMARSIMTALGVNSENVVHIPYIEALGITDFFGEEITRQHMWHYLYDLTKLKSLVPEWKQTVSFNNGIKETVDWLLEDKRRCRINDKFSSLLDELYKKYL